MLPFAGQRDAIAPKVANGDATRPGPRRLGMPNFVLDLPARAKQSIPVLNPRVLIAFTLCSVSAALVQSP
jgi:hypothetical protein